jgi:hypothetical protein
MGAFDTRGWVVSGCTIHSFVARACAVRCVLYACLLACLLACLCLAQQRLNMERKPYVITLSHQVPFDHTAHCLTAETGLV